MNVYAESSALLAWLFRETNGAQVHAIIAGANNILTSDLALIECSRVIHRETASGRLAPDVARQIATDLDAGAANWVVMKLTPSIIHRARQTFPNEPIRSLDALHMAWAIHAKAEHDGLVLLSLDNRIRRVGESLGFDVRP